MTSRDMDAVEANIRAKAAAAGAKFRELYPEIAERTRMELDTRAAELGHPSFDAWVVRLRERMEPRGALPVPGRADLRMPHQLPHTVAHVVLRPRRNGWPHCSACSRQLGRADLHRCPYASCRAWLRSTTEATA